MLFVALKGDKSDGRDFIPQALAAGAVGFIEGLEALHAAAREYRSSLRAKVVAVTGSAGKTTTKELIKAFLSRLGRTYATEGNYNNHIGLPMTILNCPRDAEYLVLEMGSNHPGEIAALCDIARPDVGVVTNVGTAHIEFFGSREGIAAEKGELLKRAPVKFSSSACPYLPGAVDTRCGWLASALSGILDGPHNTTNAALAYAVAEHFGLSKDGAVSALEGFSLPGARWRKTEKWGAVFIDDSYNASPDSMIAAIDAFADTPCDGRHIAVLGDMFELGGKSAEYHRKIFAHAMAKKFHLVIGVGEESSKCLCNLAYRKLSDLKKKFRVDVSAGDLVLLKASNAMKLGELIT